MSSGQPVGVWRLASPMDMSHAQVLLYERKCLLAAVDRL